VPGSDAVLRHPLANPLLAHPHATSRQLLPHARPAVFAFDLSVNGSDVRQQSVVGQAASLLLSLLEFIGSARDSFCGGKVSLNLNQPASSKAGRFTPPYIWAAYPMDLPADALASKKGRQ
jgi:hypothetical protein